VNSLSSLLGDDELTSEPASETKAGPAAAAAIVSTSELDEISAKLAAEMFKAPEFEISVPELASEPGTPIASLEPAADVVTVIKFLEKSSADYEAETLEQPAAEVPSVVTDALNAERSHARLGGSSSGRWINCPGSVSLSEALPTPLDSYPSRKGTLAHEVAELALRGLIEHKILGTDPDIKFDLETAVPDPFFAKVPTLTDDDKEKIRKEWDTIVEMARGYRDAVWEHVLEKTITGKAYGFETYFSFAPELPDLDSGGFVDFWSIHLDDRAKRVASIVDYKSGFVYVDVTDNSQLMFYAAALRAFLQANGKDIDYVVLAIYQPESEPKFRSVKVSAKKLDAFRKKALKAVHTVYYHKKPALKVGSWCQWCPAKAMCPKYRKSIEEASQLALTNPETAPLPDANLLPMEDVMKVVFHEKQILGIVKACKARALQHGLAGGDLHGGKIVIGGSRRKWLPEESIRPILSEIIPDEKFLTTKMKGITEVEKLLKKTKDVDADSVMARCTVKPQGKLTIVPVSDERVGVANLASLLPDSDDETEE